MTGSTSRTKGQSGERELAALLSDLTGRHIKRRVRQHDGDADLEGLPGWAIEVKRYRQATPALIAGWWDQACRQAERAGAAPILFYRVDRQDWRCVWPAHLHLRPPHATPSTNLIDTLQADPLTWWRLVCSSPRL